VIPGNIIRGQKSGRDDQQFRFFFHDIVISFLGTPSFSDIGRNRPTDAMTRPHISIRQYEES
jgi:hypothetical protein